MVIATWNLNNRVGRTPFRIDAAHAATSLGADTIIFTEYFPQQYHGSFCQILAQAGYDHQLISRDYGEVANRILIASLYPFEQSSLPLPEFDNQFPSNILAVFVPFMGLHVIGLRIPSYGSKEKELLVKSWGWLEAIANTLRDAPAIIIGDLNVTLRSNKSKGGEHFRRILSNGWRRAEPKGMYSYYGPRGVRSEIDHMLVTEYCAIKDATYVIGRPGYNLAGVSGAISDHAALIASVTVV